MCFIEKKFLAWHHRLKEEEDLIKKKRLEDKKPFLGKELLQNQGIDLTYIPNRSGRRMWCISANKDLRKGYINYLKSIVEKAREVYAYWKQGGVDKKMPIGVFSPAQPVLSNLI